MSAATTQHDGALAGIAVIDAVQRARSETVVSGPMSSLDIAAARYERKLREYDTRMWRLRRSTDTASRSRRKTLQRKLSRLSGRAVRAIHEGVTQMFVKAREELREHDRSGT